MTANDHTLTLKSIATQKTSNIVTDTGAPGLSPGDTVEYTINFQVSDYFAFQNIVLTDLFSDGQKYVAGSATLSVDRRPRRRRRQHVRRVRSGAMSR